MRVSTRRKERKGIEMSATARAYGTSSSSLARKEEFRKGRFGWRGRLRREAVRSSVGEVPTLEAAYVSGSFDEERRTFVQRFRLRSYEVDDERMATITALANMLQEVATNHVLGLWGKGENGFPVPPEMGRRNLAWVMARMKFQIEAYPTWGDVVEIRTWFCEAGKLAARRDWELVNAETGQRLGGCTSMWVCLDMTRRRMSRIPESVRAEFERSSPLDEIFVLGPGVIPVKLPEVVLNEEYTGPTVLARRTDIDMNGHVNNVTYIGWALEALPLAESKNFKLREIEIEFKNEALQGERVTTGASSSACSVQGTPGETGEEPSHCYLHSLRRETDGEELVVLRSRWCPK